MRVRRGRRIKSCTWGTFRPEGLSRWLVFSLCFLAMAVQSLIVQTHLHAPGNFPSRAVIQALSQPLTIVTAAVSPETAPAPGKPHVPIDEDQNCPVCQQFHSAGAFFGPTAALFALPAFVNVRFIALDDGGLLTRAPSHIWRGRAPPQA